MRALVSLMVAALALTASSALAKGSFPETIALPNGWQPEGIAIGNGTTFYVGSIPTGAVYRGDLRTGKGAELVAGQPDGPRSVSSTTADGCSSPVARPARGSCTTPGRVR